MVNKIGLREAEAAYLHAMKVWQGGISEAEAGHALVSDYGMNKASASDMLRNFAQLLKGEVYHLTLSLLVTEFYFDRILEEFGPEKLRNAIASTRAHIQYYESLPSGGARPGLNKLCDHYDDKLIAHEYNTPLLSSEKYRADFQELVNRAQQDTPDKRQRRLQGAGTKAKKITIRTLAFRRNADVVAERLYQANGVCDHCKGPAPFNRKNGTPYLEVHHPIPLADGGEDTLGNTMALCPNCHREAHFGEHFEKFKTNVAS